MKIYILTLFPHLFEPFFKDNLIGNSIEEGYLDIEIMNFRDFSQDKHRKVDDVPYGGGGGMVLKPEPIWLAYQSIPEDTRKKAQVIIPSPRGKLFRQQMAMDYSEKENLIVVCGQYKGIDQRIPVLLNAEEISIGDYVLTGGELPALIILNAILRFVPGVLGDIGSALNDSFTESPELLGHPSYTRPKEFQGLKVPEILFSGNHKAIDDWRREQALETTRKNRPDLDNK